MTTKNRILVLSASVGAGHMRAAQAVELALKDLAPNAVVKNLDILTLTNAAFRRVYAKSYFDLVERAPHVLGYLYDYFDRPSKSENPFSKRFKLLVQKANLRKFFDLLEEEPWDIVVNTHFLPAELIASLKKKNKFKAPHLTVTTDFDTHLLWVNQPCEHYFTATDEGALYLQALGIPAKDCTVTGIPIHPLFSKPKERAACIASQGLGGDRPIVLQSAGGFGVGPIETIYKGILSVETPLEVVLVAGKNEEAKKKLEKVPVPPRHRAKVLGFTDKMDELMAAADVVVSKPGGLTTSEVLARGAAMCIVNPIPGQESRNSDFLLEHGAAIKINNLALTAHKLQSLLGNPERLARLKANAKRLGKPNAAYEIARRVLDW
ncbi:MAG: UDP-N-acetylglucosamine--LPS N-acetylglucosamine transferase [Planctomycetota bacterium]|nr:UDP-N-acetylglucosamine--LPS N-acetylglucosamine transferase [Planctomycetota bacterium]